MKNLLSKNSIVRKVSIITVSFNSEKTIEDTIKSVRSQDYPNIEHIIIDGLSTDNTMKIVSKYYTGSNIISEKDNGLYDAMNKGLDLATGDIIGFLNSDDFYSSRSSVRELVDKMTAKRTSSIFADLVYVHPDNLKKDIRYYKSGPWFPWMLRFGKMPAHPTFLAKKECYDMCGYFDCSFKISADYELLVRMLHKNRISYAYLKKPVVKMRLGGVSTAGVRSSLKLNSEIVKACQKNGLRTNIFLILLKVPFKLTEIIRFK